MWQSIVQTKPNDSLRIIRINDENACQKENTRFTQCHLLNGKITVFNSATM